MLASIVKKASAEAGVGLTMTEVPADLLGAEELHLRGWSTLVTDQTLVTLAKKNDVRAKYLTASTIDIVSCAHYYHSFSHRLFMSARDNLPDFHKQE